MRSARLIGRPTRSWLPTVGCGLGCAALLLHATACAAPPPSAPLAAAERGDRIRSLEESIARDHGTLEDWITSARETGARPIHLDASFRELARRLGENERELEALRATDPPSDPVSSEPRLP